MDPNLEFYRSTLHLPPREVRKRMAHLPESERGRVWMIVDKEEKAQRLQELIADRDLVQLALINPSEIIRNLRLKYTLFGRNTYRHDESMMVLRITAHAVGSGDMLVDWVADYDQQPHPLPLDAWKLAYCDVYYVDGGSATVQEIYEARLREEDLQTPAARARELVRYKSLKRARRNAKWMIPAIERLTVEEQTQWTMEDGECLQRLFRERNFEEVTKLCVKQRNYQKTLDRLWRQVSPPPPAWIQNIVDAQEQWGFVYYVSREALEKYGHYWKSFWGRANNTCSPMRVMYSSIHHQGHDNWHVLNRLVTEHWPMFQPDENLAEDDDLRQHFRQYIKDNRSRSKEDRKKKKKKYKWEDDDPLSPGILRNTFVVVPIEILSGNSKREEGDFVDPCWVWAYDADWENSEEETVVDGEKYQGRVKVAKWSLEGWFYAARWEGVSLKDMWLKAQQHPEKFWICYTKEMEEWDHEPYI